MDSPNYKTDMQMAVNAVWKTITLIYGDDPRIKRGADVVQMPVREVVTILASCIVMMLANVPKNRRDEFMRQLLPAIEKGLAESDRKPSRIFVPDGTMLN